MWVETFPHRELVNLAVARAIYVDQRGGSWFVAADLAGSHRTLVDGLDSKASALEILRGIADEVIRLLSPVVRIEQRLQLSSDSSRRIASPRPSSNGNGKLGQLAGAKRSVPAAPVVELLRTSPRPIRAIAREAAAAVGVSSSSVEQLIHRLRRGEQSTVRIHIADRLAIALGQHPAALWPGEW